MERADTAPEQAPAGATADRLGAAGAMEKSSNPQSTFAAPTARQRAATGAAAGAVEAKRGAEARAFAPAPPTFPPAAAPLDAAANAVQGEARAAPLAPLLAALRETPSSWSRATDSGGQAPIDAGVQRWLAELDAAAAGRWVAADAQPPRAAPFPAGVALLREGSPVASLRVDGTTVTLDTRIDGRLRSWRAELAPAAAARARAAVPPAPR